MRYLLDRLREPGTLRSLAVVLFGLLQIVPEAALLESIVQVGIVALGAVSAAMPERSSPEKVGEVAAQAASSAVAKTVLDAVPAAAAAGAAQAVQSALRRGEVGRDAAG